MVRGNNGVDTLYGGTGADTVCAGNNSTGDFLSAHGPGLVELTDAVDKLWANNTITSPTGACQANDLCGNSSAHGTYPTGGCTCAATSPPAACPNE